ncbi:hypothetical protein PIB30_108258, partial [Stylosanthes scabra]|nr:hypothetical protein [Stylosanthes scabra]
MNRDEAPSLDLGIDPPLPQREEARSFDLGIDPPLLTTQDLSDIEELDELVQKAKDQFQTPQPIKIIENQKELEEKAVAWATVPKGGNEFETIFKLAGDIFLSQVRMFEKHGQSWMDIKNNRPHAIASSIFAPILFSEHWWLYVMDIEKREFFVLDSKNIVSPSDERSSLNRFAVGAPSIFDQGSCSLLPRYVNIPGQPNETDCGPKLEEFRKELVAKIILSKDNEKRLETIRILNDMRNIRPTVVLRSPYVQVSSAD